MNGEFKMSEVVNNELFKIGGDVFIKYIMPNVVPTAKKLMNWIKRAFRNKKIPQKFIQNNFKNYILLMPQPTLLLSFTVISFPSANWFIASFKCCRCMLAGSVGLSSIAP